MSTATKTLVSVILRGNKFELRSRYDASLLSFYRSLPNARFSQLGEFWTCDATPSAAAKICRETPAEVQAENAVRELAARFIEGVNAPLPREQPPVRKADLRRHQVAGYHFAMQRDSALLAHEMGSGKSFTTVAVVNNRNCRAVLILCPVSVRGVWRREFAKWSAINYEVIVLEKGTVARKIKEAAERTLLAEAHGKPFVVVTNYESARDKKFVAWAKLRKWDMVIADESHRAKSHDSSTSKQLAEIGKCAKYRLALTGTPMPHSPLDIFGQFRFLDAGIFGTSFTAFRGEYAITGALGAYHIVGYRNLEQLAQRMNLLTHEVKMSDTDIELPPVSHIRRSCEIEDRKGYDDLCEEMIAQVDDGTITASNALVKLLRLQQWTSGVVVDDDGVERMTGTEKRGLLEDLLEDLPRDRPVVVFCNFIRSLDIVAEVVTKSGRKFGEISGRRKDLTANSEFPPDIDVLAVQYQAGGVGIDLTRANYAICYDHTWNMGNNDQAMARVHRPGQVHPTFIYHLIVENTIDDVVVRALERKRDVVEGVLEFLRGGVV